MQNSLPIVYCFVSEFNLPDLSRLGRSINIIFRNYKNINYLNDLLDLKFYCKKNNINLYLSNDLKLSIKLGLNGVYIPSFNNKLNYCGFYNLPKNFNIIGSAHNVKEIKVKSMQGCKEIFISPLFKINKSKKFLEIIKFNLLTLGIKNKFIALGGINEKNYKKIKLANVKGFATISWAKKNGLRNILRPF
jgi:thiamine-phosphate pyrophosphorylase